MADKELEVDLTEVAEVATPAEAQAILAGIGQLNRDHFDKAITLWFHRHIHNSPVSRSTEAYNHVQQSLPALYDILTKEV